MTETPYFRPYDPQVQVFINNRDKNNICVEFDVFACDAFMEEKGKWKKMIPDMDIAT